MSLESLGADASVYRLFEPFAARDLILARVAASQRDRYHLLAGAGEYTGEPSGALRYQASCLADMPVTGDWVAARVATASFAIVEAVLPRKTLFSRRAAGRREDEQPVAANIDLVFLVCGLDGDYNLRRLERYITLAAEAGTEAVVVLNKSDLCPDIDTRLRETASVAGGIPVVPASTLTPSGLDELRTYITYGRTVALLGSSGVGKSAIVNGILGEERMRSRDVRASDSRGRHTTTRRELIPIPSGSVLIDTPGMRELQLWAGEESVDRTFSEILAIGADCRFRDCSHNGEKGCAVASALERGVIDPERWRSYLKLLGEARRHEELTDRLAAAESKKRLKSMSRSIKAMYKERNR